MAEKRADTELLAALAECPAWMTQWRHYKTGDTYIVVMSAVCEATLEPLVVYRPKGRDVRFVRPLSEWEQPVEWQGSMVLRFTRVEG